MESMYLLFDRMKLAVEPAGAATTAAALGPLAARLRGRRSALIVCGANIDPERYSDWLRQGAARWQARERDAGRSA
jgi:threonine dehydratase